MIKLSVSLTFYGGVNEIGGNKILLRDGDKKILLDFGMSFRDYKKYFSMPFLQPRGLEDLLATGLFPLQFKEQDLDAILLSHAHLDHCKYVSLISDGMKYHQTEEIINFLDKGEKLLKSKEISWFEKEVGELPSIFKQYRIPVICSKDTYIILDALYGKDGCQDNRFDNPDVADLLPINYSKSYSSQNYVMAFPVNHSILGASGWIINTEVGPIAYTGDFKMGDKTNKFIENAEKASPEVLIIEGTNIGKEDEWKAKNLMEYQRRIENVVYSSKKMVFIDFDYKDLEKFGILYHIAQESDRQIIISSKLAHILSKFGVNLSDSNILLFDKETPDKNRRKWERKLIENFREKDGTVKGKDLQKNQENYIFCSSFFLLKYLVDIKPIEDSPYIISHSEPFDEESEIAEEILTNWINLFGLKKYRIHVSGHASHLELINTIEKIGPKILIPVHTEHPEMIKKEVEKLGIKVILPQYGKEISI